MRFATWNLNTAFTSKAVRSQQWSWIDNDLQADLVVLTEAELPVEGLPAGWSAVFQSGGIGANRRWGTIVAAKGYELRDVTNGAAGKHGFSVSHTWPGTVVITDVIKDGDLIATVVGVYAMNVNLDGKKADNGRFSTNQILNDLDGLLWSKRGKRLIMAGDFNLFPRDIPDHCVNVLWDMVESTAKNRAELGYCCDCGDDEHCGHMWTHRNRAVPERVQNLDYVFVSSKIRRKAKKVLGGDRDFSAAWEMSDHAPVVVEFEF